MTASTEQTCPEFEAAWAEFEALHESDPFPMGARSNKERALYWWQQAARHSPVVPTPEQITQFLFGKDCVLRPRRYPDEPRMSVQDVERALAAAPVQLPETSRILR